MTTLYIGNKNYSSWSMRPWVLMTGAGIAFDEVLVPFDDMAPDSPFKTALRGIGPTGNVPVLVDDGLAVWDTLAIAEYLAERHPDRSLWPRDAADRARARSVCAEMHAGFNALRQHLTMNIEADLGAVGERLMAGHASLRQDLARLDALWSDALGRHGGPMLFGTFGIADAFYAPVATRLRTYGITLGPVAQGYAGRLLDLPTVRAWCDAARLEHRYVPYDEPYRDRTEVEALHRAHAAGR